MRPVEVDILITGFICRSLIFIRMADCDSSASTALTAEELLLEIQGVCPTIILLVALYLHYSDSPLDFFIRMADCDDVSDSPLDFFIRIADCDDVSDSPLDFFIRMADSEMSLAVLWISLFDGGL